MHTIDPELATRIIQERISANRESLCDVLHQLQGFNFAGAGKAGMAHAGYSCLVIASDGGGTKGRPPTISERRENSRLFKTKECLLLFGARIWTMSRKSMTKISGCICLGRTRRP